MIFGNTAETAAIVEMTLFYYLLDEYLGIRKEDRGDIESAVENVLYGPKRAQLADPIKALYPESPRGDDAIPLSLPLEKYTGVYHNIGYRNITITISKSEEGEYLHSIIDRTWAFIFDFEHVSGEYFIVKGYPDLPGADIASMDPLEILLLKAEFQVGEDGEVAFFGANLEPQMGEKKIWFRKIEDVA